MNNKTLLSLCLLLTWSYSFGQIDQQFDLLLEERFKKDEPGGVILVQKNSKDLYVRAFGISDLETDQPIDDHTIFNTGSISKTFVAYGILILLEEGQLSIEDPISKYFTDFDNKDISDQVKIKHLLSHSSGLPDVRNVSSNPDFYLTAKDKENFDPIKQIDRLNFNPGERFQYSNPAFNGLALIIESVTGQKWQQFIKERIFEPAGMMESMITDGAYPDAGVSHAYQKEGTSLVEDDYGEYPTFAAAGNGGVWCSIRDLAKYEMAINENVFLNSELSNIARSIYIPDNWKGQSKPHLGFSWFVEEKENPQNLIGVTKVYHTGSQGGFRSFYISIPEKEILFVALFNRPVDNLNGIMEEGLQILKMHDWRE